MANTRKVDVVIIGAGSAGMRAYREVSKVTDSVLLIEGDQYGTTCARVGCMPSKLLIAAAEAAHFGQHTAPFGVTYSPPKIHGKAVMQRLRSERDRFVGFVVDTVEGWPENHRLMGHAVFKSDHVLQVGDVQVHADRVVIATGSRPNLPDHFKVFKNRLIVNDDVFYWEDLPNSVAVFGAGIIGLELGQALNRLGVKVALFGRNNKVKPLTDPEVIRKGRDIFCHEFDFYPDPEIKQFGLSDNAATIEFTNEGKTHHLEVDYVLAATGRSPNVDRLGLENTTLPINDKGMPLFNLHTGQIGDSHVFIAGDANNQLQLLHEASDEGTIAGYNAAHYPKVSAFKKSAHISVVFTDPQIMLVGQSFYDLKQAGFEFEVGQVDWSGQGRARVMLINQGLLRVYGERGTGRFLGAEMIGPRAEHLAHLLAWSLQSNLTVSDMLERPFYHPVIEEGLRTALQKLNQNLNIQPQSPPRPGD